MAPCTMMRDFPQAEQELAKGRGRLVPNAALFDAGNHLVGLSSPASPIARKQWSSVTSAAMYVSPLPHNLVWGRVF